jgi:DNA-directed RNA polymerase specialized sigma24 family protein
MAEWELFRPETGKNAAQFTTTHWSVVMLAGQTGSPESAAALEKLCRLYWPPVYFFARRKGYGDADAKDLTQQFFSLLLTRNDFAGLDATKGKLRTFLLAAFTHFLANEHDRAGALKRGGGQIALPLDDLTDEQMAQFSSAEHFPPAKLFDKNWALTMLGQSLMRLKMEMTQAGKEPQFHLLKAFLTTEGGAADYAEAAQKLGVAPNSVPVLVHRLRQRFRELVRAELAQTVATPSDLDEEMRHLFDVLNE